MRCPTCGNDGFSGLTPTTNRQGVDRFLLAQSPASYYHREPAWRMGLWESVIIPGAAGLPLAVCGWLLGRLLVMSAYWPVEATWLLAAIGLAAAFYWRLWIMDLLLVREIEAEFHEPEERERAAAGVFVTTNETATGTTMRRMKVDIARLVRFAQRIEATGWDLRYATWTPIRNGFSEGQFKALLAVGESAGWWAVDEAGRVEPTAAGKREILGWRDRPVNQRIIEMFRA